MTQDAAAPSNRPQAGAVPLAIVGMSCLFPESPDLEAYWKTIRNGVDAIRDMPETHWSAEDYFDPDPNAPDKTYARRGGFLPPVDFNPLAFGIAPNALEATDTAQLLGLYAAQQALEDAGYGEGVAFDRDRVSVLLGVTGTLELSISLGARLGHPHWRRALASGGIEGAQADAIIQEISDAYVEWQESSFPGLLGNVVAGRIANRLDLGGTNCVVDAACASSLSALHLAALELQTGRCDMALTGGVDTLNDIFMYMCFSKTPALSPTGNARPFDANGDGTILGEGVGILVLKRLDDAVRDGDRIYAEIHGLGTASDGKGNAIYAPVSKGQAKALRRAYAEADFSPATIELVEAHGTGTVVGDAVESEALRTVYREQREDGTWCAIGSVKSQIGHTKAAAGAASLIKTVLALHHKTLPPTIKVEQPLTQLAPGTSPFYVNTLPRPWITPEDHPRRAAISAFGFGGANYHCVLQEHVPTSPAPRADWDGDVQILPLSAPTKAALAAALETLAGADGWTALRTQAAERRAAFDPAADHRLVLVLQRDAGDLAERITRATALLQARAEATWSTPDGIHYGSGAAPGSLAFLFPGQGAQYVGMQRELACRFPPVRRALEDADAADDGRALADVVYPHPAFDDETRAAQDAALRDTRHAQPAIGALSLGAAALLASFGLRPDAVAGHSFGELSALCVAGRYDAATLHRLARLRGELMSGAPGARGAMLAVAETADGVERVLREEALDLRIANRNAPTQNVLSGTEAEIARAATIFRARQIDATPLPVSAAFHSPLVADAEAPLAAALQDVAFEAGSVPVYANTTAAVYPEDPVAARALLAGQLARPVAFADEIRALYDAGVRTFVEVGPNTRLTGLVGAILADDAHEAIALDASRGRRSAVRDLAAVLATAAARGHAVDLRAWDDTFVPPPPADGKPALTFPVGGANIRTRPARTPASPSPASEPPTTAPETTTNTRTAPMDRPHPAPGPHPHPNLTGVPAMSATPPPPASPWQLQEALRITQQNMMALQQLQQQTAMLHQQFLHAQQASQQQMQALMQQQQRFLDAAAGAPATAMPMPVMPMPAMPMPAMQMPAPMPQMQMQMPAPMPQMQMPVAPMPPAPVAAAPAPVAPAPVAPAVADPVVPAPAAPVAPAAGAAAPAAGAHDRGDLEQILLGIVAEKTGYPADILELGMELDADLGIDSIKRVEILSALQDAVPEAPAVKPDQLGTLRTLQSVLDFIQAEVPATPAPSAANGAAPHAAPAAATPPPAPVSRPLQRSVLQAREARPGGASAEEAPASTASDAPLWISDDDPALAREIVVLLESQGHRTRIVSLAQAEAHAGEAVGGLVLLPPREGSTADSLWHALALAQRAGPGLRRAGNDGGACFLTVARLDGAHGTSGAHIEDPLSGALAGLAKTAGHEWPEVRCRAIDLAADLDDRGAARLLVEELFHAGPDEVGLSAAGRRTLALLPGAAEVRAAQLPLEAGDVVVVSGGARGVTAEAALALAEACRPTLVLLGRSPEPAPEPAWLAALHSEGAVKHALLRNGQASSPREAGAAWHRIRSEREVRANLDRLRATGATVRYLSADVCDAAAVRTALEAVHAEFGPVRLLVHGAGVLADQHILEKTEANFRRVFDTKVAGLHNLLAPLHRAELRGLVLFSSTTARYGRVGQVDYAMANEALNKLAQQDAQLHPDCRVVSLGWGPWAGGMVDETLRTVFAGEGIPLIPLAAGAAQMVAELAHPETAVERIVMGPDPDGPVAAADAAHERPMSSAPSPAASSPLASALPVAFTRTLDVGAAPFLRSHVIDGHAVVPMAMMPEWLAHGAMHGNPGLRFHGFDQLQVLKGLLLTAETATTLRVHAGAARKEGPLYRVPAELRSVGAEGREAFHARADILLADQLPVEKPTLPTPTGEGPALTPGDIYPALLFHGPDMQGIETLERCVPEGVRARIATAPAPSAWMTDPVRRRWLGDPLALDVAIQLLTVWTTQFHGAPSLPCRAGHYRQFRAFPAGSVHVTLRVRESNERRAVADIEFLDDDGRLIARVTELENTIDAALAATFRSNQLTGAEPA